MLVAAVEQTVVHVVVASASIKARIAIASVAVHQINAGAVATILTCTFVDVGGTCCTTVAFFTVACK